MPINPEIDQETGEVVQNEQQHPKSFASFLSMLEDGQFHSELSAELQELNSEMQRHQLNYGSKAKGKITINLDFALSHGVFEINSKYKVSKPESPRAKSVAWSDANNNFIPNNPKQNDMFKDVNSRVIKNV